MAAPSSPTPTIALGLIAAPGFATDLASELADDLPAALAAQVSAEITWEVPVVSDPLAAEATRGTAMIDAGRERMVREGWDLAVVLTDVPLRIGRRPVVADASATHGVALVSLPTSGLWTSSGGASPLRGNPVRSARGGGVRRAGPGASLALIHSAEPPLSAAT